MIGLMLKVGLGCVVVLVQWVLYNLWVFYQRKRQFSKIPGHSMWPLFGNSLDVAGPNDQFLTKLVNLCHGTKGRVMRLFLGKAPYVVLYGARGFETILGSNKHITKGDDYVFLEPWMGTGLLTANGDKWRRRRKMLTPAFHFSILEDFRSSMVDQSRVLVQKMHEAIERSRGKEINVFPLVTLCALDIICDAAMGRNVDAQNKGDSPYVKSIFAASEIIFQRIRSPWIWSDLAFNLHPDGRKLNNALTILHNFTDSVIKERKESLYGNHKHDTNDINEDDDDDDDVGQKRRLAFLDLMLAMQRDDANALSDEDIREEVDTFMFEGHDTTAANMSFTLLMLAMHPEVQTRVMEELDAIFEGDKNRGASIEDLGRMRYLECCIKESLRLFPSVPLMTRRLKEEAVLEGHSVPADTSIVLFTYLLHRDPEFFPNPEAFDPDRFSDDEARRRHAYAYVPFSAGNRNCIGQKFAQMEEKVLISTVLRNFNLTTSLSSNAQLHLLPELVLRPEAGAPIKLTPREDQRR